MGLIYHFSWSLFIVYDKMVSRMPWPAQYFLFSLFPGELSAQREVMSYASVDSHLETEDTVQSEEEDLEPVSIP